MSFAIQPHVFCENCIKCGTRPIITQAKNLFTVKCPNQECNNAITGTLINLDEWNRVNKKKA